MSTVAEREAINKLPFCNLQDCPRDNDFIEAKNKADMAQKDRDVYRFLLAGALSIITFALGCILTLYSQKKDAVSREDVQKIVAEHPAIVEMKSDLRSLKEGQYGLTQTLVELNQSMKRISGEGVTITRYVHDNNRKQ